MVKHTQLREGHAADLLVYSIDTWDHFAVVVFDVSGNGGNGKDGNVNDGKCGNYLGCSPLVCGRVVVCFGIPVGRPPWRMHP
jgi:hypothetical protein